MKTRIPHIVSGVLLAFFLLTSTAHALKPTDQAIIELYQRVEDLQRDVNRLRGENEQLRHELHLAKKEYDKKLSDVNQAPPADHNVSSRIDPARNDAPAYRSSKIRKVSDNVAYRRAYDLIQEDKNAALADFGDFIKEYPSSPLAANAHYWIGEIWYSRGKYKNARNHFLTVLKEHKGSGKEPDAALKLGYSFVGMKEWDYARTTFEDVIKHFPNTTEADLARKQLNKLRKR